MTNFTSFDKDLKTFLTKRFTYIKNTPIKSKMFGILAKMKECGKKDTKNTFTIIGTGDAINPLDFAKSMKLLLSNPPASNDFAATSMLIS